MSPCTNRLVCIRSQRGGFALLITIVLLAFLVLLLVSLATLTRVETTVAQNSRQLDVARQNALFAMQVAIGQLQQVAGPDQRVTARADILGTSAKAPYWTGVWQARNPTVSDQFLDQGSNLRNWSLNTVGPTWLVSKAPGSTLDPLTYVPDPDSTKTALLARGIGVSAVDVQLPLVSIIAPVPGISGDSVIGRYAYWVSDEGVKAKVNLVDPTFGQSDQALSLLHMASPQALPLQRIFPLKDSNADYRSTPSDELTKILSPQMLPFLSTVPATVDLKSNGPDITAYSWGVLADVQHGGLKRDLTAAFENPAQFDQLTTDYGYGDRALYRANAAAGLVPASSVVDMGMMTASAAGHPNPDGPLWHSLFYFYNIYKPLMTTPAGVGSSTATPTSSINLAAPPHVLTPRIYRIDYPNAAIPTILDGIAPIVLACRVDIALTSYRNAADGKWKLRLQYYPQLVLKNPYSVRLSLVGFRATKGINAFRGYSLSLRVGGVVVPAFDINQGSSGGRYSLGVSAGNMDVLEPGETRVFALATDAEFASIATAGTFLNLTSPTEVPSTSADHYQSVNVTGFVGTSNSDALVEMTLTNNPAMSFITYWDNRIDPALVQWPHLGSVRFSVGSGYSVNPAPSEWSNRSISSLETPVRVIGYFTRLKGLQPSTNAADYFNGKQNIPMFMGNAGALNLFDDEHSMQWEETYLSPAGAPYLSNLTAISTTADGETSWGDQSVGEGAAGGSASRIVLRDVPAQPMVSLGQFMHASFYRFTDSDTGGTPSTSMTFGSMFVGGSIVSPFIPADRLSKVADFGSFTGKRLFIDDSFLANQALFDRFFFSTVPPATLSGNAPAYWTAFNAANSGPRVVNDSKPLPNTRLKLTRVAGELPLLADLRDSRKAAAHLLLDGAFNINSTSVPAWRALLSALSGNRLNLWNATGRTSVTFDATQAKDSNPIPRFWSGSTNGTPNAAWDGLRMLTDKEIDELASRIVDQVRARGPFLSMADFLNRRLGADNALTRAGALQAAIDNTSPDINAAAKARGVDVNMSGGTPASISTNLYDSTGNPLNTAVGMPGYLMQQDLVQDFSPVMTARSDTFVIRTRGDAVNAATGVTEGRAWLEAVVQRTPAYIDQTDPKLVTLGDATPPYAADGTANIGDANILFGRRFVVVRFRWLNENEL